MRLISSVVVLMLPLIMMAAGPSAEEMALYNAREHGALAKECLRVVDQDGVPVAGARVWGGLQTGDGYKDFIPIDGITDINGEYVVQGKCTKRIACVIMADGYYVSEFTMENYCYKHSLKDGKWHPYGETKMIGLKKIKKPVLMIHARNDMSDEVPLGEWHGYDIERRQWLPPYGDGVCADMLVRLTLDVKNAINDFKATMEVSFTNNPCAGAYILAKDRFSEMKSEYEADTNGHYQASFAFVKEKHVTKRNSKFNNQVTSVTKSDTSLGDDSYLVFRTRTKVDLDGNLVSAHYGKIYGPWEFFHGMRASNVQFNPTPNDPNLEDEKTVRYSEMRRRQILEQIGN